METEIRKHFWYYEKEILPKIKEIKGVTQIDKGYHWLLTHTEGVVFRGIYFAVHLKQDPIPVIFACAGHDLARTHDGDCLLHGPQAVPLVQELMSKFDPLLSQEIKTKICFAIENHSIGTVAPDYISACLRDADRVRLAWELWYQEKFFNTDIAKKIASWSAKQFLEYENHCLWRRKTTDHEGILLHQ